MYFVKGDEESVKVSFSCNCPQQIFEYGGDEMLATLFGDFECPKDQYTPGYDVTLSINKSNIP